MRLMCVGCFIFSDIILMIIYKMSNDPNYRMKYEHDLRMAVGLWLPMSTYVVDGKWLLLISYQNPWSQNITKPWWKWSIMTIKKLWNIIK